MSIGNTPRVVVAAGTGPALLVMLSRSSRERPSRGSSPLDAPLRAVGDTTGEAWLNLFGVSLDVGAPYTAEALLRALDDLEPIELRRHLLGRHAWSWCALAGVDVIEAAAAGDDAAGLALLASPRYYGGHAAAALSVVLELDPDETKQRIVRAVEVGADLAGQQARDALAAAHEDATAALAELAPLAAIEHLTGGYRYVPEPEAEQVVLVPHLEPEPQLVLAQHRNARVIAYRTLVEPEAEERLLTLGRALSDPKRVEILGLVARGTGRVQDLVGRTGLSRSTVHHHLALLRDAGLVALEGNARSYTFRARHDAANEVASLMGDVIGDPHERKTKEE